MRAPEGARLREMYALAYRLRRPVHEVLRWPAAEIDGWQAWFTVQTGDN